MISSYTRTIAIIGDPIEHSLTPRIQNRALSAIDADIVNVAFRVAPENLRDAVRGAQKLGLLGLMVTIPHKENVLELCDELDESARLMGAANLLQFRDDGRIIGYSSDGWAALKSLAEEGATVENQRVAILGGGGAARSLALTFVGAGAQEIVLLNRTIERAQSISTEVAERGVKTRALVLNTETCREIVPKIDVLVNTTSLGMSPEINESPIEAQVLAAHLTVYDIVYNPLETRLLREAKSVGARVVDGLGMLIYTNVFAVQTCANLKISARVMREEALRALGEKSV